MKTYTLKELAERFSLGLVGDGGIAVSGMCALLPGEAGKLGFLSNPKHRKDLAGTAAAAVILGSRDASDLPVPGLVARDPYNAFAQIARLFDDSLRVTPGIHPSASIASTAEIGEGCEIGPQVSIGEHARLGAGCKIGPGAVISAHVTLGAGSRVAANAVLCDGVTIGARANILPCAVVGSRGFGNARAADGSWLEVPQLGSVIVGDDVEIGANTTIDRGALGNTVIEDGVKLDNLIQIAHNCVIGAHTAIASQTGIAGSTRIGKRCMLAGAVAVNGHIQIADDVVVLGFAMVTHSLTEKGIYGSGMPVMLAREWRKTVARINRLEKTQQRVRHLEQLLSVSEAAEENPKESEE